jgi:hypothetical protein
MSAFSLFAIYMGNSGQAKPNSNICFVEPCRDFVCNLRESAGLEHLFKYFKD